MNRIMELLGTLINFAGSDKAMALLAIIMDAVRNAEEAYSGIKQGVAKKEAVMDTVRNAMEAYGMLDGRTEDYVNMIVGVISEIVDAVVAVFNVTGFWGKKVKIELEPGDELK